jgi:hypothetical protein
LDAAISTCTAASTATEAASGQAAADAFNSGLGFSAATKLKAHTPVPVSIRQSRRMRRAALDLGSCSNPAIVFSAGFDGRKEDSIEPADTATFTHGSAPDIEAITGFISRLQAGCKASAGPISAAESAATAAADVWNSAWVCRLNDLACYQQVVQEEGGKYIQERMSDEEGEETSG